VLLARAPSAALDCEDAHMRQAGAGAAGAKKRFEGD